MRAEDLMPERLMSQDELNPREQMQPDRRSFGAMLKQGRIEMRGASDADKTVYFLDLKELSLSELMGLIKAATMVVSRRGYERVEDKY